MWLTVKKKKKSRNLKDTLLDWVGIVSGNLREGQTLRGKNAFISSIAHPWRIPFPFALYTSINPAGIPMITVPLSGSFGRRYEKETELTSPLIREIFSFWWNLKARAWKTFILPFSTRVLST